MKHIHLGTLDVARIGLGTMGMSTAYTGAGTDDVESIRTIHRALDLGVTLIDTAESSVGLALSTTLPMFSGITVVNTPPKNRHAASKPAITSAVV
ncbi:MAG: hypothetical protein QOF30_491 [Acidimicrobiaceae bacterium]|jgi:hypothetical protein|nr:hypothetical protein [Acidimicrobiaceae bacterium]